MAKLCKHLVIYINETGSISFRKSDSVYAHHITRNIPEDILWHRCRFAPNARHMSSQSNYTSCKHYLHTVTPVSL